MTFYVMMAFGTCVICSSVPTGSIRIN
uniref:Uncharacterized protein n=1 Tax=Rhizophora mucronata TaxID=61149 RepID=A0A2P2PW02_RHIMU